MRIATTKATPAFTKCALVIEFESQKELDTLTALMARTSKVPDAVFHAEQPSSATRSLNARGIYPSTVRDTMKALFVNLLDLGGKA